MSDYIIKIAVLDFKQESANLIEEITSKCLTLFCVEYELRLYRKPQDLFEALKEKEFDIFLLVIETMECLEADVACCIKKEDIDSVIIYITTCIDYGPREFEVNPYRYIPQKQLREKLPEAYRFLCEQLENRKKEEKYYIVENEYPFKPISYREIYYFKKERDYVWIVHKNGEDKLKKAFAEILNELKDKSYFTVIGGKYIVSILHIMSLKERQVYLRNGNILFINREHVDELRIEVKNYWKYFSFHHTSKVRF